MSMISISAADPDLTISRELSAGAMTIIARISFTGSNGA